MSAHARSLSAAGSPVTACVTGAAAVVVAGAGAVEVAVVTTVGPGSVTVRTETLERAAARGRGLEPPFKKTAARTTPRSPRATSPMTKGRGPRRRRSYVPGGGSV